MRKSSFQKNHDDFEETLDWYRDFIARIVGAQRVIRYKYEKTELVEALVLRIAALWETLVLEDLVDSLNRDPSKYAAETGLRLRRHLSRDECEAIIVGDGYRDFRSVDSAIDFAKKHLADAHNPFKLVPKHTIRPINEFCGTVRNYLSHYSSFARRRYHRMLTNQYGLKRMREPGDFLLATNKKSKNLRLVDYFGAFEAASVEMRKIGN